MRKQLKKKGFRSRSKGSSRFKKRFSKFLLAADAVIEYKNLAILEKYVTARGKILSRRITGISAKQQREITRAVKQSQFLGLLPVGSARRKAVL